MTYLEPYLNTYNGNKITGTSYLDEYRNARRGLGALRNLNDSDFQDVNDKNTLLSGLKSQKGSAIAGGAVAGLGALTTIASNTIQGAKINDTTGMQNQIDDLSRVGSFSYNNYDELSNAYSQANAGLDFQYDDIRGMDTKEKVGNIASSTLSGAAAGMQIGGPWGALIGGVVGAGASIGGILTGNAKARVEGDYLNLQAQIAQDAANSNLEAAHEQIADRQNRKGMVNAVAKGGPITRQRASLRQLAGMASSQKRNVAASRAIPVTKKCNGGIMVRIKSK